MSYVCRRVSLRDKPFIHFNQPSKHHGHEPITFPTGGCAA